MKTGPMLVIAVIALTGCVRFGAEQSIREDTRADPRVGELLFFADRLAGASAEELHAMPERRPAPIEEAGALLRHALWLATAGHEGYDPVAARDALEALATRSTALDAPTRALVRLQLRHLRTQLELREETAGLAERNRRLLQQIQELTALERQMGGNGPDDEQGETGRGAGGGVTDDVEGGGE
ncbi:MAG: hypothetical protein U5K73_04060 [Halofilum sp. (in: g-proteobacteria)]|nr:hypothetical protein [Halofilum sp. (in: g-proteobacteria)]